MRLDEFKNIIHHHDIASVCVFLLRFQAQSLLAIKGDDLLVFNLLNSHFQYTIDSSFNIVLLLLFYMTLNHFYIYSFIMDDPSKTTSFKVYNIKKMVQYHVKRRKKRWNTAITLLVSIINCLIPIIFPCSLEGGQKKKLQHSVDEYHNGKLGVKEVLFL